MAARVATAPGRHQQVPPPAELCSRKLLDSLAESWEEAEGPSPGALVSPCPSCAEPVAPPRASGYAPAVCVCQRLPATRSPSWAGAGSWVSRGLRSRPPRAPGGGETHGSHPTAALGSSWSPRFSAAPGRQGSQVFPPGTQSRLTAPCGQELGHGSRKHLLPEL